MGLGSGHLEIFVVFRPYNKKQTKTYYKQTKKTQEKIKKTIPTCKQTSMGMSGDYKIALSQGATEIRIGTALFGERNNEN